ncbi:MAG TPA: glycoside hydrolase family 47 [Bacteroidales bacterium]|nr:glycoside hydrolase family 47 [Bacteroidales bacterium]
MVSNKLLAAILSIAILSGCGNSKQSPTSINKEEQSKKIVSAAQFAWQGYMKYAKGFDALKPISKQGENWYHTSLQMTPIDAFDTFTLMGLKTEADEAKDLIFSNLNFDIDMDIQLFEINIRLLGGLLSAYELDGDKRFLTLAEDLCKRLLPAFKTSTGMPYRYVNLKTGALRDSLNNPAEIGTCLLEFCKLTQLTGDSTYYKVAKNAVMAIYKRRSSIDLVGTIIDVTTGEWKKPECQIGARLDSYFEYLYKNWLLTGDKECYDAWETHRKAIEKYLITDTPNGTFLTRVDMNTGKETRSLYGALDAFYAGLLALSGDVPTAQKIQEGNFYMWTRFNIEPEVFDFKKDSILYPSYPLRPENIESCFYLYRKTNDPKYLAMGKRMSDDIIDKCKTNAGFGAVKNVTTLELDDSMESFFFAETLKYSYLLFASEDKLDLEKLVFNTEAHPLKIQ